MWVLVMYCLVSTGPDTNPQISATTAVFHSHKACLNVLNDFEGSNAKLKEQGLAISFKGSCYEDPIFTAPASDPDYVPTPKKEGATNAK